MIKLCWIPLLLTPLFVIATAQGKELDVVYRNNLAVGKVARERALDAYGDFISLLAHSPFDPTLQYNVGSSLNLIGEPDKAINLYVQLLKQVDELSKTAAGDKSLLEELGAVRFAVLYNLGVQYQSVQDIDNALKNYQLALELVPESKEIKTNIEMLLGQGGGKGKDKDKKDDKGEGGGKDPKDKDPKDGKDKKDPKEQKQQGKKSFDQKQMSMEDLKRIMEELKQQEQGIRAKFQGKGGQDATKEKEW